MHPSTAQAAVIVDELVRCGVTEAVLCPGSRNAPLSFALHAADAEGRLRLHVRIDERGAGFLALGLALRSGRPVPTVCTSGTAAANLHPAVLEADQAGVPLLALTADRPVELIGTGANQTISQAGLYGPAVRLCATLGVADSRPGQQGLWRSAVDRAVAAAAGVPTGRPGPVQLNLPFREPLAPGGGPDWPESLAGRPDGSAWTAVPSAASADVLQPMTPLPLDPAAPTLILAGHGAGTAVPPGVPVIAEPTSPLWRCALRAGPWLLDDPALRPRQAVVVGRPTLHRGIQRLLADEAVAVFAVPNGGSWPDVTGTVRAVGQLPELRPPSDWMQRWLDADAAASRRLDAALDSPSAPVGLRLARELVAGLPAGALLVLGSSNPVRDVSLAARPRGELTVLANRGVSGIDGTVSTAVGAALAHGRDGGGPSYALLGDLTMLHDMTGLVLGPVEPRPDLTLVVLNDHGGGIFGLLEQGAPEHAAAFERIFGTPHDVRLDALCAAMGVPHTILDDLDTLAPALKAADAPGIRVVEVPADRASLRAGHAAIRAAISGR